MVIPGGLVFLISEVPLNCDVGAGAGPAGGAAALGRGARHGGFGLRRTGALPPQLTPEIRSLNCAPLSQPPAREPLSPFFLSLSLSLFLPVSFSIPLPPPSLPLSRRRGAWMRQRSTPRWREEHLGVALLR